MRSFVDFSFAWNKKEFSTNLKGDTLNTGHTHHLEKEIPQAPQLEDGKGANYFGVKILNTSQEEMKNGHKTSHVYN